MKTSRTGRDVGLRAVEGRPGCAPTIGRELNSLCAAEYVTPPTIGIAARVLLPRLGRAPLFGLTSGQILAGNFVTARKPASDPRGDVRELRESVSGLHSSRMENQRGKICGLESPKTSRRTNHV